MLSTRFYINPRSRKELVKKMPIPRVDRIVCDDDRVVLVKYVEEQARKENVDRSVAIRRFMEKGIAEFRKEL